MKHINTVTAPAKADLPLDHPNLVDSIVAFLQDPQAVLAIHKKEEPV